MGNFFFGLSSSERLAAQVKVLQRLESEYRRDISKATKRAENYEHEALTLRKNALRRQTPLEDYQEQYRNLAIQAAHERARADKYSRLGEHISETVTNLRLQSGIVTVQQAEARGMAAINQFSRALPLSVLKKVIQSYEVNMAERQLLQEAMSSAVEDASDAFLDTDTDDGLGTRDRIEKNVNERMEKLRAEEELRAKELDGLLGQPASSGRPRNADAATSSTVGRD